MLFIHGRARFVADKEQGNREPLNSVRNHHGGERLSNLDICLTTVHERAATAHT